MSTYNYAVTTTGIAAATNLSSLAGFAAPVNSDLVVTNTTGTFASTVAGAGLILDNANTPNSIKYTGKNGVLDNVEVVTLSNANAATTVNGGTGVDTIKLTTGTGTLIYDALDNVTAAAGQKFTIDASSNAAGVNWDLSAVSGAANIVFANAGGTAVNAFVGAIGTQHADTIKGAAGLAAGTVTLNGGAGADTLTAQSLGTKIVYDASDKLVNKAGVGTIELTAATDTAGIQLYLDGNTVFTTIATVTGGSGNDDIRGDVSTTLINGGKGVDYIWGGLNTTIQTLNGGAGNDQIYFGAGEGLGNKKIMAYDAANTTFAAGDVVNLYNISAYDLVGAGKLTIAAGTDGVVSTGTDSVTLLNAVGQANATRHFVSSEGWAFDVVFGGTNVTGTAGVIDNLVGGAAASTFDGKGGNDNIYTAAASNIVYHAGDSIFVTAAAANTLTATSSSTGVQMYVDSMVNTGANTFLSTSWNLVGSAQDDEIRGQADVTAQTLNGGAGNDALWGGAGSTNLDTLIGGAGADTYYYGLDEGNDVIQAGTSAATGNALDTLNFYNVTDISKLSGTLVPGADMTISVAGTGTTTLTLQGWGAASGINKLTNVVVNGKEYTLSADASNNAVFTAK